MDKHWVDSLELLIDACVPERNSSSGSSELRLPSPGIQNQPQNRRASITKPWHDGGASTPTARSSTSSEGNIVPTQFQSKIFPLSTAVSPAPSPVSSEVSTNNFFSHAFDLPPISSPKLDAMRSKDSQVQWAETSNAFYTDSALFETPLEFASTATPAASPSPTILENRIKRYLAVLDHTSSCFDRRCSWHECFKMKAFVGHVNGCAQAGTGCRLCRRFYTLSRLHASKCERPIGHCPVLFCSHFKLEIANSRSASSKPF
jgi:hypothetical protein